MKSREVGASPEEKLEGERRSLRLTELTERFILRRGPEVNRQYLPEKSTPFISSH